MRSALGRYKSVDVQQASEYLGACLPGVDHCPEYLSGKRATRVRCSRVLIIIVY